MGALSYSQAKHLEIQYFTELIWNKPHLRPEGDNFFLLPLSGFLCQRSRFHHRFCSTWDFLQFWRSNWKVQLAGWVFSEGSRGVLLVTVLVLNGRELLLGSVSALSSPCFYLGDVRFVPGNFSLPLSTHPIDSPYPKQFPLHWSVLLYSWTILIWIIASFLRAHSPRTLGNEYFRW